MVISPEIAPDPVDFLRISLIQRGKHLTHVYRRLYCNWIKDPNTVRQEVRIGLADSAGSWLRSLMFRQGTGGFAFAVAEAIVRCYRWQNIIKEAD
jgi:predicted amidohydrolase